jgi:hypothetical protein
MRKLILGMFTVLVLTSAAAAEPPQAELPEAVTGVTLASLALATATAGVLLAENPPEGAAFIDGCYIWQQPGVALVITNVWRSAQEDPSLWLAEERLVDFLIAQRDLRWEEPFIYPREPEEGADGFSIEPAVYLLDAGQATQRLDQHLENLLTWIDFNPGMEFILPVAEHAQPEAAVVFIDSSGPIEFYFQSDETGMLKLTHLIHFNYFSA